MKKSLTSFLTLVILMIGFSSTAFATTYYATGFFTATYPQELTYHSVAVSGTDRNYVHSIWNAMLKKMQQKLPDHDFWLKKTGDIVRGKKLDGNFYLYTINYSRRPKQRLTKRLNFHIKVDAKDEAEGRQKFMDHLKEKYSKYQPNGFTKIEPVR